MIPFEPRADGTVEATFEKEEVHLLATLASQVTTLLESVGSPSAESPLPGLVIGGSSSTPDDDALARLLPDAYADETAASEFRQLTELGLASRKVANARVIIETADTTTRLDATAAMAWMRSINDIRLVIAARLGIEDDETEIVETEESAGMFAVYDWLAGVQDSLVRAMDR